MKQLCVICPLIGQRSETFIRRHVVELAPGKVTAIALRRMPEEQRGWDVDCPTLLLEPIHSKPVRAIARAARSLAPIIDTARIGTFFRQHGVQVVLGEYLDFSWRFVNACDKAGVRLFAHAHGYDISTRLNSAKWVKRYQDLDRVTGIITVAEEGKRRLREIGLSKVPIHVIPCGAVQPMEFHPRSQGETLVVVAVGRFVPKKAPLNTIRAFEIAHRDNPSLRLEMVGDGPLFEEAREYVREKGLGGVVLLHGAKGPDFVMPLLSRAHIYAQHSLVSPVDGDREGLPVAVLEAMGAGLPVVSTRHAGIPEAVVEGETGLLVDEGDVEGMGQAMSRLASDASLREEMGRAGWQRGRERFSWDYERSALRKLLGLD